MDEIVNNTALNISSSDRIYIPLSESDIQKISEIDGNKECVDCKAAYPEWASLGFGTLCCLLCAGRHRALGVHITLVRSLKMDDWSEEQMKTLFKGGNDRFKQYTAAIIDNLESPPSDIYTVPKVLYFSEILKSIIEERSTEEYDAEKWSNMSAKAEIKSPTRSKAPSWVPDEVVTNCQVCSQSFSFFFRRHHCRRCGKCVCSSCAPDINTRPIIEWGLDHPVRHCKLCYKSPLVDWK
jgi:hypothetical protein